MLNVAIGVGSAGATPRLSGSFPGTGPAEKKPVPALVAAAGLLLSATLRRSAVRRRSAALASPEAASLAPPRRFPPFGAPALFERERPLSRPRLL
jgi:hypothetical protein